MLVSCSLIVSQFLCVHLLVSGTGIQSLGWLFQYQFCVFYYLVYTLISVDSNVGCIVMQAVAAKKKEQEKKPAPKAEPKKQPEAKKPEPKAEPKKQPEPKAEPKKQLEAKKPEAKAEPKKQPAAQKGEAPKSDAARTPEAKEQTNRVRVSNATLFALACTESARCHFVITREL